MELSEGGSIRPVLRPEAHRAWWGRSRDSVLLLQRASGTSVAFGSKGVEAGIEITGGQLCLSSSWRQRNWRDDLVQARHVGGQ